MSSRASVSFKYRRASQIDEDEEQDATTDYAQTSARRMTGPSRDSPRVLLTEDESLPFPSSTQQTLFPTVVDWTRPASQRVGQNDGQRTDSAPSTPHAPGRDALGTSGRLLSPANAKTPSANVEAVYEDEPARRKSILKTTQEAQESLPKRDKGRSLKKVLFNRGASDESIELKDSGPSRFSRNQSTRTTYFGREASRDKKSDGSSVKVVPMGTNDDYELPPRPRSKRNQPRRESKITAWITKQRVSGPLAKVERRYHGIKNRIEKSRQIPPSKDGRHLDLDCTRRVNVLDERTNKDYINNLITSSRYTTWNFLPKQLMFQFGKIANFYFLMISILQMIPGLSTTGNYTTIVPLLVFISISMGKEGYDDLRRHRLDKVENNSSTSVLKYVDSARYGVNHDGDANDVWEEKIWQDVRVGDVIRLRRDDPVPADMVLLHSDGENGIAYIETMALDGETNLKAKMASPELAKQCKTFGGMANCSAHFVVEDPNIDLYNFDGRVTVNGETLPLTVNEVIYRGSIMRNTSQAIGMVINTGEECKIRMNANKNPRIKFPSLQLVANRVVLIVVAFVLLLAIFMTSAYQIWYKNAERHSWYLARARVAAGPILTSFIIMFNTMIPLSLYVSMEIIKLGQLFLMHDVDMYDPTTDTPMEARTTTINEELGQVSYIFSDKTGTLTDNIMRFRKLSVAGVAWLHDYDLVKEAEEAEAVNELNKSTTMKKGKDVWRQAEASAEPPVFAGGDEGPSPSRRGSVWKSTARPAKGQPEMRTGDMLQYLQRHPHGVFARKTRFFLLSLALCHTCLPETQKDGTIDFQAASPDELALVRAAQELGYLVVDRATRSITLKSHPNGPAAPELVETYEVLDVIEFSSKRKRMSIIVRFPDGRRCIFTKGADSIVMKLLKHAQLATSKIAEVERRASLRRSLEVESARRKRSDAGLPRRSNVEASRKSVSSVHNFTRTVGVASRGPVVREQLDTWLRDQEHDVDLAHVDNPNAYVTPRASMHLETQHSLQGGARLSFVGSRLSSDSHDRAFSPVRGHVEQWDDIVDESLAMNEAAVFERCFQHIDDFATEGLRTLLYGYKFLDQEEYTSWKKIFLDASTSLVNRQELIEKAGEQIEHDLELAGATAIEDKLQKGVPETIDKLRRANIKMWMLTGDKRETAINIGHSCRLIKDYSNVIIIDHEQGNVEQTMGSALFQIDRGDIPHSVVVVDGQTLNLIESDELLSELFFELTVIADSVICCRASPSQKALLVRSIREKINGSVTLAIGDGANDIAMIQEAHVGIGITGREGLQAARTSDYSIAQFRFLSKLLLVHGRWNYVRTSKYILGTFWKEMVFYLTQAMYQRWNGYTGTSLYESWSMSMFNTLFTSLPVIILGTFEQDLKASTLLAVPELYVYGQLGQAFNIKKYFWWMFMGTCEAVLVFWMMYGLYGLADDKDPGIFAIGDLCFSVCVIVINTKLLIIEMHTKTYMSVIGWLLSIGGWTLWNLILNFVYSRKESQVYSVRGGFIGHFGKNPAWWCVIVLSTWTVLVFEYSVMSVRKAFKPEDTDVFQELEKDPILKKRFEDAAAGIDTELQRDEGQKQREAEVEELLARRGEKDEGDVQQKGHATKVGSKSLDIERTVPHSAHGAHIPHVQPIIGHELTTILSNTSAEEPKTRRL